MPLFHLPWQLPLLTLAAILFICGLAASLGIRKMRNYGDRLSTSLWLGGSVSNAT